MKKWTYETRKDVTIQIIDILLKVVKTSKVYTSMQKKIFLNSNEQIKSLINNPELQFKTVKSLILLEKEILNPWHVAEGEDAERFWSEIERLDIGLRKKNILKDVLKRGEIVALYEYNAIIDDILVNDKSSKISSDDLKKINQMVLEYEKSITDSDL